VYLRITPSKNTKNFEFTLINYMSDSPLYIKEGETLSLPGPLSKEIRAVYYPTTGTNSSTINVYHPRYPMTVGASFIATNKTSGEVMVQESFVTTDSPTGHQNRRKDLRQRRQSRRGDHYRQRRDRPKLSIRCS
jgi:hypothetical protein